MRAPTAWRIEIYSSTWDVWRPAVRPVIVSATRQGAEIGATFRYPGEVVRVSAYRPSRTQWRSRSSAGLGLIGPRC